MVDLEYKWEIWQQKITKDGSFGKMMMHGLQRIPNTSYCIKNWCGQYEQIKI